MIRYCKQQDNFSCGPVAIINAMKWRGMKASMDTHLGVLKKLCGTDKNGTYPDDMGRVLKKFVPGVEHIEAPPINLVDKYLDLGKAFIISYAYVKSGGEEEGHFAMCIGRTKNHYIMVNDTYHRNGDMKSTISKRSRENMKKIFANAKRCEDDIEIWVL